MLASGGLVNREPPAGGAPPGDAAAKSPYVLGYTMKRLDGTPQDLAEYKGKVVLIVNVASKCGLTPQYKDLQALYEAKKEKGLVVLGFPANNFMEQEPGTDAEIAAFCEAEYSVTFPMFSKISVKGDDQHELYRHLSGQAPPIGGDPEWNFTKFLVDRNGNVVARIAAKTRVNSPEVMKRIDELLEAAAAAPAGVGASPG
ncbi:MAG: glutathione peroxidase [Phycisphaeraceae bacterium]|nr:glutathione peroxidase [Phycisphaeraceae bacterium]